MTRLINADELKKAMDGYWGRCQRIRKPRNGETAVFLDVMATVEKQPTVDAVPVRHGKWLKAYGDHEAFGIRPFYRYCSCCNEVTVFPYNYCPNCGARMDEE